MSTENKRFYWIKLRQDFFNKETIDWLQDQENGYAYIVLYLKLCLMTANNGGKLIRTVGDLTIPYDVRKISQKTGIDFDTVTIAMGLFKHLGLLVEGTEGVLNLPEVPMMVGNESASKEAIKKRKQRQKNKAQWMQGGTNCPQIEGTNCPTEYRDKSIEYRDKSIENRDKSKENREEKVESRKKETGASDDGLKDVITAYRKNIYPMPGEMDLEKLKAMIEDFGSDAVIKAIDRAVTRNKRSLAYIHGILKSWRTNGYDDEMSQPRRRQGGYESRADRVAREDAELLRMAKEYDKQHDSGNSNESSSIFEGLLPE